MTSPGPASLTQTDSFRLRVQRAEATRTTLMLGVLAALTAITVLRRLSGGAVMRVDSLYWTTVGILGVATVVELFALRAVRRANRDGRLLNDHVWVTIAAIEVLAPLGALAMLGVHGPQGAVEALSAPAVLLLPLVIMLSVLHLRPRATLLSGMAAAAGHLGLVVRAIAVERPPADSYPQLLTYPAVIALCGAAGALACRHLKRYVHEAADEAAAREQADQQLRQVHQELSLARDIQQGLIPSTPPSVPGFDIAGLNRPADLTGGDYYDWQPLPDGRLALVMADVTGHGIAPAMVMAVCRAYARASTPLVPDSAELLRRLNTLVHDDVQGRRFITLAIALLEPSTARVELSSAGHGPTLLYRATDGSVERFGGDGIPLGLLRDESYEAGRSLDLRPGDVLLMLTDGFFEWSRPSDDEQFGIERLEGSLRRHAGGPARQIVDAIDAAVRAFAAGSRQPDDMTAIVVKRL